MHNWYLLYIIILLLLFLEKSLSLIIQLLVIPYINIINEYKYRKLFDLNIK